MIKEIKNLAGKYYHDIVNIRRHLHQYPELSFEEVETGKYGESLLYGQTLMPCP